MNMTMVMAVTVMMIVIIMKGRMKKKVTMKSNLDAHLLRLKIFYIFGMRRNNAMKLILS